MKGISNTSRTLEYIRQMGWEADKVEQFNPYAGKFGKRKDLFGIIDIIALGDRPWAIGIQSCGQAYAEHEKSILGNPMALKWIEKGNTLMLIGWRKILKQRGGKLRIWAPRIKEFKQEDFK